ncbi:hypothetical protein H3146_06010 [Streptomyces sp. OF3]|uniref:Uncharacterized protein n=1 Tax=Streptomyces alkaliterrae TaxID=2213162 RepID=A0A7W3WIH2_9ACTN|nr:hypothetical protein [Streptomyces alkaliterrae]MBB1252922.1 hypothetical protein [Streptomyces alkaliterrae]
MAANPVPARKKNPARPAKRRSTAKTSLTGRLARRTGAWAARTHARRRADRRARTDAAILRRTHAGCTTCGGLGVIHKRKKDGSFAGSKSCPAKPAVTKVSRIKTAAEARYGQDRRSGLHGWSCPCGKRARPQWRTAKDATRELRVHEKRRHDGQSIGGTWYVQIPATATTAPIKRPALAAA